MNIRFKDGNNTSEHKFQGLLNQLANIKMEPDTYLGNIFSQHSTIQFGYINGQVTITNVVLSD